MSIGETDISKQSARTYATQGASRGFGASAVAGVAAVAGGAGYYYYANVLGQAPALPIGQTATAEAKKAFTGGDQGFISLKLESVDIINHNTKKMRFSFPEDDMVSGLAACCEWARNDRFVKNPH